MGKRASENEKLERQEKLKGLLESEALSATELAKKLKTTKHRVYNDIVFLRAQGINIELKNHKFRIVKETEKPRKRLIQTPEGFDEGIRQLITAIITQAVKDYKSPIVDYITKDAARQKHAIRNKALSFLRSEDCLNYCEAIGVNRNAILENLGVK